MERLTQGTILFGEAEKQRYYNRLKEYENTGLTPEEILDIRIRAKWKPVEEQLPEESGYYWATIRHPDGTLTTEKYYWKPGWPCEDAWREVVVAWQPYYCPEPYDNRIRV